MRILVINRWDDDFADYSKYVDESEHLVSYVTVPTHAAGLSDRVAHVERVDDLTDVDRVLAAVDRCVAAAGPFDKVLGLSEFDLVTAGMVRDRHHIPGPGAEAVRSFRDKPRMKEVLAAAGVRVPRYRVVRSTAEVAEFVRDTGGGDVIVKPRGGAASVGCVKLPSGADPGELLAGVVLDDHEVEEFVTGPIWHVDGLVHRGELVYRKASRYIGTCYDFGRGCPLGSVVQAGPTADAVVDFAAHCLRVLGLQGGAFHLEVIEAPAGLVFLEVGARVGGGEIPFTSRDVYGIDLVGDWIRIELGQEPVTTPGVDTGEHAGFLMLPEAVGHRVVARRSMVGTVPELYAEVLPPVGHVFDGHGGYETLLGRFRYRGASAEAVERAIRHTVDAYRYELEPVALQGAAPC